MPFRWNPFVDIVKVLKKCIGVRRELLIAVPVFRHPKSYCERPEQIFAGVNGCSVHLENGDTLFQQLLHFIVDFFSFAKVKSGTRFRNKVVEQSRFHASQEYRLIGALCTVPRWLPEHALGQVFRNLLWTRGFTIPLVRMTEATGVMPARRSNRLVRHLAIVCLLLMCVSSYDAIHIHGGSQQEAPVAPHHCLLCLAGHLPLTVHAGPNLPMVAFSRPAALVPDEPACYVSTCTFSLFTRPPPAA